MRTKAIATVVLLIVTILSTVLAGEGILVHNLVSQMEPIRRSIMELDVLQGINVIESVHIAVDQALEYSVYQAVYDVAARGGHKDAAALSLSCEPYWKVYLQENFPENYADDIRMQMRDNMNKYAEQLSIGVVKVPSFGISANKIGADKIEISATATDSLKADKPGFYTISTSTHASKTFDLNFDELYTAGRNEFLANDPVGDAIRNAETQIDSLCRQQDLQQLCVRPDSNTCERALNPQCDGSYKSRINEIIGHSAVSLTNKYSSENLEFAIRPDTVVTHDSQVTYSTCEGGATNCGCGCAVQIYFCPAGASTVSCPSGTTDADSCICRRCSSSATRIDLGAGICQRCDGLYSPATEDSPEVCGGSWVDAWVGVEPDSRCDSFNPGYYNIKCSYDYKGASAADVTITDKKETYIVHDDTTGARNINLKFFVISSDPDSYQPISPLTGACVE